MAHGFRNSPFVAYASGIKPLDIIGDYSGGQPALDHLGKSSLGDLYWNNGTPSMGLVCGPSVSIPPIYARLCYRALSELIIFQVQRELYHRAKIIIALSKGPGGAGADVSQLETTFRAVLIPFQHSYRPLLSQKYSMPTATT
jgi:hypothetical protein